VATGARTVAGYAGVTADVLFLGVWALHPEHGISGGYFEESEVRRALLGRADRVVGLASKEKLNTVAPFPVGPASALTHLATDAPANDTAPFEELGLTVVR
jgi:DeoR/GlpR family transcriptional regulator of sugar metabolism